MEQWDGQSWITEDWRAKQLWMQFTNNRVAMCNRGLAHWGDRAEVYNHESHNCGYGAMLFGQSVLADSLIEGNSLYSAGPDHRFGFQVSFHCVFWEFYVPAHFLFYSHSDVIFPSPGIMEMSSTTILG
jgi:hypothetical protein